MIKLLKFFFISIFVLFVGLVLCVLFFFGDGSDCNGDSKSANYVKSLSEERLIKLYGDMVKLYQTEDKYLVIPKDYFPEEFSDLDVISLNPGRAQILVMGCFDNYMHLNFYGIKDQKENAIKLRYGEIEVVEEQIWPN